MAHNLNSKGGKVSMFYAGETPWHELGTRVDKALTSAEAIVAAGLDYTVEKRPIFLQDGTEIKGKYATVRTDTNDYLGIVGPRYEILQNKQGFALSDSIVGFKEAMYETAGALGKGEKIWLLVKLPGYVKTLKDDVTEKFLLFVNTHDGTGSAEVLFTPIRVVCQNTLSMALWGNKVRAKLRHTTNIGLKVDEVRQTLGIVNQTYSLFEDLSKKLTTIRVSDRAFKEYVTGIGMVPEIAEGDTQSTRAQNIMDELSDLFETGKGTEIPGVKGTAWGAYNAVVEYVDFHRGSDDAQKRANSILFGSGSEVKQKAWDKALALA